MGFDDAHGHVYVFMTARWDSDWILGYGYVMREEESSLVWKHPFRELRLGGRFTSHVCWSGAIIEIALRGKALGIPLYRNGKERERSGAEAIWIIHGGGLCEPGIFYLM